MHGLVRNRTDCAALLERVARSSADAFIAGDWSCVSLLGCVLLKNAFQTSHRKPADDAMLKQLWDGLCVLMDVLLMGPRGIDDDEKLIPMYSTVLALEVNEDSSAPARWHTTIVRGPTASALPPDAKRARCGGGGVWRASSSSSSVIPPPIRRPPCAAMRLGRCPGLLALVACGSRADLYVSFAAVSRAFRELQI